MAIGLESRFFNAFSSRPRPTHAQILRPTVRYDGEGVRALLAAKTSKQLCANELRTVVEGRLWMLAPEAFRYFLPAFLRASLESYETISVFASELLGALTKPVRADVEEALERVAEIPPGLGLASDVLEPLREQQLEWFDSGIPLALFHERFDDLTPAEGAAVLAFLVAFEEAHGEDFPFDELPTAIARHWGRYRAA